MSEPSSTPSSDSGLLGSLRRLGTTALAAVETRLNLLGTDVEREGLRLAKLLLWGAVCLFLAFAGVAMLVVLVVIVAEEHRVLVAGLISGLFLGTALAIALFLRNWLREQPKPFEATLTELAKDRERMGS